ncbi:MAG: hypothetical protein LBG30_06880 [Odoribacteraceae bacterium]|jgi:hypothetical protein|nr:hypothetical protein [Odoribacteraceae bacterium]
MNVERLIQTRSIHLLFLLPFILAGIVLSRYYIGPPPVACRENGALLLPFIERHGDAPWLFFAGALWLLLHAYLLFFIVDRQEILARATVLPPLVYLLLTVGLYCRLGVSPYLLAATALVLSLHRLQQLIARLHALAPVFDFGLLIALAVLLCPKLLLLLPWSLLVLLFSGRDALRDILVLLLGLLAASAFVAAIYFLLDDLPGALDRFQNALHAGSRSIRGLSLATLIALSLVAAITLVSIFRARLRASRGIVPRRRGVVALLSLLFVLCLTPLLIPLHCRAYIFPLAVPLAYLHAGYFSSYRHRLLGRLLFLSLLLSSLLLLL